MYKSNNPGFPNGAIVNSALDWAEYTHIKNPEMHMTTVLENKYHVPLSHYTGVLGMPGFTAYRSSLSLLDLGSFIDGSGMKHIGDPKKGETIFISAAAGAVGQLVGQLSKLWGASSRRESSKVKA